MHRKAAELLFLSCALFFAGCQRTPPTPAAPSAAAGTADEIAGEAGETLKVTAPALIAPTDGTVLEDTAITLVAGGASGLYSTTSVAYDFEVYNPANVKVRSEVVASPAFAIKDLELDTVYRWRVRATSDGAHGPWSAFWSFATPKGNEGYIRGNELYDPLVNGKTIGVLHGPTTFLPDQGLRFHSQLSYVHYVLPETLREGEFSVIISGMDANTEGDKTKLISMAQGFGDIVTNDRRMTIEKRGDPAGVVAWRFITHDDQVDTEGPERQFVGFKASQTYFLQATWRANVFGVIIREGGVSGPIIYNHAKRFKGAAYDPNPHVIYLGSPVGRSGPTAASVDNVTFRQVWVSSRPRPAFANK